MKYNLSNEDLNEDNFCLKFELDSMANHLLHGNHERWVYGFMNSFGETLHLERYKFAKNYINNKKVLDIAGGCGYGTFYLAEHGNPNYIHSVDLDASSVRYATHRYPHEKITRYTDNAETYSAPNEYDTIISFETVEHLPNYRSFIEQVHRNLKENGQLIISTPVVGKTSTNNFNKFHVIEWSIFDFQELIKEKFVINEVYVQNLIYKNQIVDSFWKKLKYKINPKPFNSFNPEISPFSNSIDTKKIHAGFQLLICTKK